jgi:hypothetical protein
MKLEQQKYRMPLCPELTVSAIDFHKYASMGGTIMTAGSDTSTLRNALNNMLKEIKDGTSEKPDQAKGYVHP